MQQGQFLYELVYQYIKSGILLGFYKKGMYLPSMQAYSTLFGVSPLTVRNAVQKLQRERFVTLTRGKPTVVIWETGPEQVRAHLESYLTTRRSALIDLNRTITLFYPDILFQSLWAEDEEGLQCLERILDGLDSGHVQRLVEFITKTVRALGNPLILQLFVDTYIFMQFADLWELQKSGAEQHVLLDQVQANFQCLMDARRSGSPQKMMDILHWAYRLSHIARAAAKIPELDNTEQIAFKWEPNKGQKQYAYRVALDLIRAVADEVYPLGSILPSVQQLAARYELSEQTLRQVMKLLCSLGIIKGVNSYQYQVFFWEGTRSDRDILKEPAVRKNMVRFLQAFQFFSIVARPLARHSYPLLPRQVRTDLCEQTRRDLTQGRPFNLRKTVQLLAEYSGLDAVQEICGQFFEYLLWGYSSPFQVFSQKEKTLWDATTKQTISALELDDPAAFAVQFQTLVCQYFRFNKITLLNLGLSEAQQLVDLSLL